MQPDDPIGTGEAPAQGESGDAPTFDPKGRKVLVIDDSPVNCRIVEIALTKEGYTVFTAFHGSEGVRLALEKHPDCIVLDVTMPDLDGFAICRMLRSNQALEGVPIIMHTCRNTKNDVLLSLKAGADNYIVKPAAPSVICDKVRRVLSAPVRRDRPASENPAGDGADDSALTSAAVPDSGTASESPEEILRRKSLSLDLPPLVQDVMALSEDCRSFGRELAGLLARDPEISSAILRLAASPRYGKGRPNQSLSSAIERLGVQPAKTRILALCVRRLLSNLPEKGPLDRQAYGHHALACGIVARILARSANGSEENAFLAGILHDVGKVLFAIRLPAPFGQALDLSRLEGVPLHEAERRILGSDHARIGGRMASGWNLPPSVQEAIAEHHQHYAPGARQRSLCTAVLSAANVIAKAFRLGSAGDSRIQEIPARDSMLFGEALRHRQGLRRIILEDLAELAQLMGDDVRGDDSRIGASVDIWTADPIRFLICEIYLSSSGIRARRVDALPSGKDRRHLVCRLGATVDKEKIDLLKDKAAGPSSPVVFILPPGVPLPEGLPASATVLREPYEGEGLLRALSGPAPEPCTPPAPSL